MKQSLSFFHVLRPTNFQGFRKHKNELYDVAEQNFSLNKTEAKKIEPKGRKKGWEVYLYIMSSKKNF